VYIHGKGPNGLDDKGRCRRANDLWDLNGLERASDGHG
jgi:hypothetical protein